MPREGRSHIPDYHFAIASGEFSHQSQSKRKIKRKTQGANPNTKKKWFRFREEEKKGETGDEISPAGGRGVDGKIDKFKFK